MWDWLKGLFWPALRFVFQCIVCGLQRVLSATSAEEAKAKIMAEGWRGPRAGEPKGWRCSDCAGR